jgi:hypothetical protein
MSRKRSLAWPLAVLLPSLLLAQAVAAGHPVGGKNVDELSAEFGTAWFNTLYELVRNTPAGNPTVASRAYAYCGVTFYEALVHGIERGKSLAGQLNGLDELSKPGPRRHHWPLVANAAMQAVATHFFPGSAGNIDALANEFYANNGEMNRVAFRRSVDYGSALADAIIDWAEADGFLGLAARNAAFVPPVVPGPWVGTGSGLNPAWGQQRTFVLESSTSCPAAGHPPFSEDPSSGFHAHAQLVYATTGDSGASLTEEQRDITFFWSDGPGGTGTPSGHWIHTVGVVATPNFPTYTSGHSTQSGAAMFVLIHQLGVIPYVDTIHVDRGNTAVLVQLVVDTRSFESFLEAGAEAAASRLYGGIHYLFDNFDGLQQGQCIGAKPRPGARLRARTAGGVEHERRAGPARIIEQAHAPVLEASGGVSA